MKLSLLVFSLLVPLFSFGATKSYQITTKFYIDGNLVSEPRIILIPGEVAEISQRIDDSDESLDMKVIAVDQSSDKVSDGIFMRFDIEFQSKTRKLKSHPQIIAKSGEEANIVIGDKDGEIQFKVTAIRQ